MGEHGGYLDALTEALKAEVVGRRKDDGSWLCECGQSCPTDLAPYAHRRTQHSASRHLKRLTKADWTVINTALAFYEATDLDDEADAYECEHERSLQDDLRSVRSAVWERLS